MFLKIQVILLALPRSSEEDWSSVSSPLPPCSFNNTVAFAF